MYVGHFVMLHRLVCKQLPEDMRGRRPRASLVGVWGAGQYVAGFHKVFECRGVCNLNGNCREEGPCVNPCALCHVRCLYGQTQSIILQRC